MTYGTNRFPCPRISNRVPSSQKIKCCRRDCANAFAKSVEHLPGNIGLFRIDALFALEHSKRPIASGLAFLHETDALILDLRDNGGGEPETVAWLCSHFFADRTLISRIRWRTSDVMDEQWTVPPASEQAFLDKPIFILVSHETASGAEGLAYFLQKAKRATIVGERTWGGAHPGISVRLSDHFGAVIPNGETLCPIDNANWERTGVVPDVPCEASDSLRKAQIAAENPHSNGTRRSNTAASREAG